MDSFRRASKAKSLNCQPAPRKNVGESMEPSESDDLVKVLLDVLRKYRVVVNLLKWALPWMPARPTMAPTAWRSADANTPPKYVTDSLPFSVNEVGLVEGKAFRLSWLYCSLIPITRSSSSASPNRHPICEAAYRRMYSGAEPSTASG